MVLDFLCCIFAFMLSAWTAHRPVQHPDSPTQPCCMIVWFKIHSAQTLAWTRTFVAVTFEVVDGAHVSVLAGLRLTHSTGTATLTRLRAVLGHKLLFELQDGEIWAHIVTWSHRYTVTRVTEGHLQGSICLGRCSHTEHMAHKSPHS